MDAYFVDPKKIRNCRFGLCTANSLVITDDQQAIT